MSAPREDPANEVDPDEYIRNIFKEVINWLIENNSAGESILHSNGKRYILKIEEDKR